MGIIDNVTKTSGLSILICGVKSLDFASYDKDE